MGKDMANDSNRHWYDLANARARDLFSGHEMRLFADLLDKDIQESCVAAEEYEALLHDVNLLAEDLLRIDPNRDIRKTPRFKKRIGIDVERALANAGLQGFRVIKDGVIVGPEGEDIMSVRKDFTLCRAVERGFPASRFRQEVLDHIVEAVKIKLRDRQRHLDDQAMMEGENDEDRTGSR